jgi:hypothetical protein
MYPVATFFIIKFIEAVPVVLVIAAILNAILWPSIGLRGDWALAWLTHAGTLLFGILAGTLTWAAVPFV